MSGLIRPASSASQESCAPRVFRRPSGTHAGWTSMQPADNSGPRNWATLQRLARRHDRRPALLVMTETAATSAHELAVLAETHLRVPAQPRETLGSESPARDTSR